MYDNLSKVRVNSLRKKFNELNKNNIKFAVDIYSLYTENSNDLMNLCINEFDLSRTQVYNYVHAGMVIFNCPDSITLPDKFSAIIPLYKVLENIEHFYKWCELPVTELSCRDIEKAVKEYYKEFMETDEERQTNESVDNTLDNIVSASLDVKNKAEIISSKLDELVNTINSIDLPEITDALAIINELQILIGDDAKNVK